MESSGEPARNAERRSKKPGKKGRRKLARRRSVEVTGLQELEAQLPPPARGFQVAHGAAPAIAAAASRRQRHQHASGRSGQQARPQDVYVQEGFLDGAAAEAAAAQQQARDKKRKWWIIGSLLAFVLLAGLGVGLGLGVGE
jgi:hypothetical protein